MGNGLMSQYETVAERLRKNQIKAVEDTLSEVNYQQAINYYKQLYTQFITEYASVRKISQEQAIKKIKTKIIEEVERDPVSGQEDLAKELFESVRLAMIDKLKTNKSLRQQANLFRGLNKQAKQKERKAFKQFVESVFSTEEIQKEVTQFLIKNKLSKNNNGFTPEDIINQVRGYMKKVLLSSNRSKTGYMYYVSPTKGFIREALVYKVFAELLDDVEKRWIIPAGSKKNAKNVDTEYDLWIDFLNSAEESFEKAVRDDVTLDDETLTGFGFQSKSWLAPWQSDNSNGKLTYYDMGNKSELLRQFYASVPSNHQGLIYSWVAGVLFLQDQLISAIGHRQVGFIIGASFEWTWKLIEQFRSWNYYYAFIFNQYHLPTKQVRWQTIGSNPH